MGRKKKEPGEKLPARVYAYGAFPPIINPSLVSQQLVRAHRHYNHLIDLERESRAVGDDLYQRRTKAMALVDFGRLKIVKQAKRADLIDTEEAARQWQVIADEVKQRAGMDLLHDVGRAGLVHQMRRVAHRRCGAAWGTALCAEAAALQAAGATGMNAPLKHREWDGTGTIAVQLQGGLSVADLLAGADTRARLEGSGKHRRLYLRVDSDGRDPIWAVFPVVYHRELPANASVKWAKVEVTRVAERLKYSAQFVLEGKKGETLGSPLPPPMKDATVAIDVGWRRFPEDGFRVVKWRDNKGESGELRFPEELLGRWEKTEELIGIRTMNYNAAVKELCAARTETWPSWLLEATLHASKWQKISRLVGLHYRWKDQRFPGDEAAFDALAAWRKQETHLYTWEAHQRLNVLRSRREIYRLFAANLLAKYERVVFEKLDLRDFAELPEAGETEPAAVTGARPRRFKACLSELIKATKDAVARAGGVLLKLPAAYTTRTCHACGLRAPKSVTTLRYQCLGCDLEWDQDDNACRNLLRAAESWQPPPARSPGETPAEPEETRDEQRRRTRLKAHRPTHSQTTPQGVGTTG